MRSTSTVTSNKYQPPRPLEMTEADLKKIEKEIADMLAEVTE